MVSPARRLRERAATDGPLVSGLVVGVGALLLYGRTLMPGLHVWDTAEFQTVGPILGIAHPTGYPSYTLLSWLASVVLQPLGEPALRINALSALLTAGAAGLTAGVVTRLTASVVVGIGTGSALALAPTVWSVGLRADPHALHIFLVALLLVLLVGWAERVVAGRSSDRWLVAAAVVYGVSLGNHALTLLLAPGIALFVLLTQPGILWRPRLIAGCVGAIAVTTVALYAYLPLRSSMDPPLDYANPETLEGFRYLVFAEQFRGTFRDYPRLPDALTTVAAETLHQLALLGVLAVLGAVVAAVRRRALFALLAAWFFVTWAFALGYVNADIDRYHLGPTLAAAVLGGIGAGAVYDVVRDLFARSRDVGAHPRRHPASARSVLAVLVGLVLIAPSLWLARERYDELDQSSERAARAWVEAVLPQLEPDAVVMSWWSYSTPLWYAQYVEGRRPDVQVIDDRNVLDERLGSAGAVIESHLDDRPVYLIRLSHDLPEFEERYVLSPLDGVTLTPVYRVEGRR